MPVPDSVMAPRPRLRVSAAAGVLVVLLGIAAAVLVAGVSAAGGSQTVVRAPAPDTASEPQAAQPRAPELYVHVLGRVRAPGVYRMASDARVIDAIAAAGGYTEDADHAGLNLARFVSDGEQLYVPAVGESVAVPPGGGSAAAGKVDLNSADAAALETLPRVGRALAQRILQWREANGRFRAIEDLLSVSGIGEKTFAGLKDLVTV